MAHGGWHAARVADANDPVPGAEYVENEAKVRYIAFDAVEIDLVGRRVHVGGAETAIEPKVFDVLVLLVQAPGKAFARDEILDAVWGHRHITPSVLNRVILRIRHALKDSAIRLHTLYGIGYRFDGEVRFVPDSDPSATSAPVYGGAPRTAAVQNAEEQADVSAGSAQVGTAPTTTAEFASSPSAGNSRAAPKPSLISLVLPVLFALLAFAGWIWWSRQSATPAADAAAMPVKQRGIAVLPLVNVSGERGERDQQFLSDGISENLITTLSQLEGVRIIGRSSSFRFRDSKEDSKTIGAKLGVAHLIEGSVQRVGDDVRISIQLIRAADGSTVWTQRFDREYKDLFALQDDITLAVAAALQVRLLHSMPGAVETGRPASGNLEAYSAYLLGTYYMSDWGNQPKAIEQFERATRLDPGYAQAWSWLGFSRTLHANRKLTGDAARETYAQARTDIDTALRLQPNLGQAHAIRANLLTFADHDWDGALAEFRIALPLVPDTDPTHGAVSRLLATLGRMNEAIAERRKYIAGDPLAAFARIYLARMLASVGRLDEAATSLNEAAAVEPDKVDWIASERLLLAILRGDAVTARALAEARPPGGSRDYDLALALQLGDDRAAADKALRQFVEASDIGNREAFQIARLYAMRGDADKTFEWMQRDWSRGDAGVLEVLFDPLLLRFRDDARFADYCRTAKLPPPSASEALGIDRIRSASATKH